MRMRLTLGWTLAMSPVLAACGAFNGAGRSLGQGVIGGVQAYTTRPPTGDSVKAMFDSIASYAGGAASTFLQPAIDTTVRRIIERTDAAIGRAEAAVNRLEDTTIARIRGPFAATLEELVRANARSLGAEARREANALLRELRAGFETDVAPALARAVGTAVDTLTVHLAASLEGQLLGALARAADSIAATGARAAVRAGDEGVQRSSFVQRLKRWAVWGVIGVLVIALGWYWYTRRRTERALEAVATAIRDTGSDALKTDVKTEALRRDVEPWLNSFLRRKGYLGTAGRPDQGRGIGQRG